MLEVLPFIMNYFGPPAVRGRRTNGVTHTVTTRREDLEGGSVFLLTASVGAAFPAFMGMATISSAVPVPTPDDTGGRPGASPEAIPTALC